jgi:hypothetical protein
MSAEDRKLCKEKINWLASIGFKELPNQETPKLTHKDLPDEVFNVIDLNPLELVKRIYDLGDETVNKIIKSDRRHK